jgi:uncharacterized protein (TIGR00268 family)
MKDKINNMLKLFNKDDRILVAFSGGVDSTFLLYTLSVIHKLTVRAVTIKTPYIPQWEVDEAKSFCKNYKIEHDVLALPFPKTIVTNPGDRCYKCKSILFSKIKDFAVAYNCNIIVDGSNADDTRDYRPGMKALKELKIVSPLLRSNIAKDEIRKQLKSWGLKIWNKPAYACLLTRIPHDTDVDEKMLHIIEKAELFIKNLGFAGTRVRLHGEIARLECDPNYIESISKNSTRQQISQELKHLGIKYVTLDMEGYRMGSLNPDTQK